MLISTKSTALLEKSIGQNQNSYCNGLFLSARWFVMSRIARKGTHLVVLPTKETAEYCAADLYHLIEGDRVFYLPDSVRREYWSGLPCPGCHALLLDLPNPGIEPYLVRGRWVIATEKLYNFILLSSMPLLMFSC